MKKTVRFTRVVERSGRPHVHTLWVPPEKDPEFKRAREAHRVMTLAQIPGGGKADFGIVGFDEKLEHGGQFLIFPKSLKLFDGARVIGVKFDLIEQPKLSEARLERRKAPARAKSKRLQRSTRRTPVRDTEPPKERRAPRRSTPPEPQPETVAGLAEAGPRSTTAATEAPRTRHATSTGSPAHAALLRDVRAAMKELERGKYVAAHQRLQRAIAR